MCIRDRAGDVLHNSPPWLVDEELNGGIRWLLGAFTDNLHPVSYTHLRAHATVLELLCRLLLEKKKTPDTTPLTYNMFKQ